MPIDLGSIPVRRCALAVLFGLLAVGCSRKEQGIDRKFEKSTREYVDLKKKNLLLTAKNATLSADVAAKEAAARDKTTAIGQLKTQLDTLNKTDETAYQSLLVQIKTTDPETAYAQVLIFQRDFPRGKRLADTQSLAADLKAKADAHREQLARRRAETLAAEEAAKRQLDARFRQHQLRVPEMRNYLMGLTQAEVIDLLGKPNDVNQGYWNYNGAYVIDDSGGAKSMTVHFDAGRVIDVLVR